MRLALACRTVPLVLILHQNHRFVYQFFFRPFVILRSNPAGGIGPFSCDPDKYRAEAGNAVTGSASCFRDIGGYLVTHPLGAGWTSTDTYRAYRAAPKRVQVVSAPQSFMAEVNLSGHCQSFRYRPRPQSQEVAFNRAWI